MSSNPHEITREFEKALCEYTGAPFAVAVSSCTMALLLAVKWSLRDSWSDWPEDNRPRALIEIPKRTYVGVPMSIIHAGGWPTFRDEDWRGRYDLRPLPVIDSARWFSGNMYKGFDPLRTAVYHDRTGQFVCVSFHSSKTLGDSQGGAILHSDPEADAWFRRARFDGRTECVPPADDTFDMLGWHCYLSPDVAARLLWKLGSLPFHNEPLPNDNYPDLSLHKAFK